MLCRDCGPLVAFVLALAAAAPASAQSPFDPIVSVRGFVLVSEQEFAAKKTFSGVFGSSQGTFLGGGGGRQRCATTRCVDATRQ